MAIKYKNTIFIKKFMKVKRLTNNFSDVDYTILLDNPEFIEVFRTVVGMSINLFAKEIGLPYSWVYNLEKRNNRLGPDGAINLSRRIGDLFRRQKFSYEEEDVKRNYCALNNITTECYIKKEVDNLDKKDFNLFIKLYEKLKDYTHQFSYLDNIILEDSRIIVVFRILLGFNQKIFAEKINVGKMTIEELENGYRKIRYPRTAREYAVRIAKLFINKKLNIHHIKISWAIWKNTRKTESGIYCPLRSIRYLKTKDFEEVLIKIRESTDNFSIINPDLFQRSPKLTIIFRILLGLTQRDLERELNLNGRYISSYECGVYKTLNRGKAELFANYFRSKLKSKGIGLLTNKQIIDSFFSVKDKMYFHRRNNFKSDFTKQEKIVYGLLKKLRINYLDIKPHFEIKTKKGSINVDFLIRFKGKPNLVIECKSTQAISKKFDYNLKRQIYSVDYRFIKIKSSYPNIRTLLVISTFDEEMLTYRIKKLIKTQTVCIDDTFINRELELLPKLIKEGIMRKNGKTTN